MRNLILGILIGVAGTSLWRLKPPAAWYVWAFFALGSALIALGFDVLFGSLKEHEPRAAWLGFGMIGGAGAVLLLLAFVFAT